MTATDEAFDKLSRALLSWFVSQPSASFLSSSLQLEQVPNAGRGIIATANIDADVELFRIPRSAVLTVENSSLARDHPTFFDDVESERAPTLVADSANTNDHERPHEAVDEENSEDDYLDPWLRLITTLIYEQLQGYSSKWKPYLDVLPAHFDTPMFWTAEQLQELQASSLLDRIGRTSADEMFTTKLIPLIRRFDHVFTDAKLLTDNDLLELSHRFGSTIMAYAFDLQNDEDAEGEEEDGWTEDREGQQMGMVPMADMLNADAEFNAHLNHEDDALVMFSLRPIKAEEEVLNYYGPLPSSDLLRRYGYVSDKHQVHDVVDIPWDLVAEAVKAKFRLNDGEMKRVLAMAEAAADEFEESFVLEYDAVNADSAGRLPMAAMTPAVTAFSEPLQTQLRHVLKALRKTKPEFETGKADFYSIIHDSLRARLAQYGTSQEEDEMMLKRLTQGDGGQGTVRQVMAVRVRLGEKELLKSHLGFVRKKIAETDDEEAQPARKRTKLK